MLCVDDCVDGLGQFVFFQQVPELEQHGSVRCRLSPSPDLRLHTFESHVRHRCHPQSLLRKPKMLLGNVHAQHEHRTNLWVPASLSVRAELLKLCHQRRLRRNSIILAQKACLAALPSSWSRIQCQK
jgi:hypothetical protein